MYAHKVFRGRRIAFGTMVAIVALGVEPLRAADGAPAALRQVSSAGHALSFDGAGYYVSNGAYALRVSFEKAQAVAPQSDEPNDEPNNGPSSEASATPLRRVSYSGLWQGI